MTTSVKEATGSVASPSVLWDGDGLTLDGLNALREPTPASEVKQRPAGNTGIMLDYVDARFVMDRLDACAGPQHWQTTYADVVEGGVRCTLSIKVMGQWTPTKTDVGDASTIEPIKGAHSDALKRAAVQWGIARDLYDNRAEASESRQRPQNGSGAAYRPAPASGGAPRPQAVQMDAATAPWSCPIHHTVKVVPAGISKATGRPYAAFYACASKNADDSYCNQKGPQAQQVPANDGQPLPSSDRLVVTPRSETYGFWDGASDLPVPDSIDGWSDAVEHAAIHGLSLWVRIDPWSIANAKARVAAIHNLSARMLHVMESRRVTGEQRVYFRFS